MRDLQEQRVALAAKTRSSLWAPKESLATRARLGPTSLALFPAPLILQRDEPTAWVAAPWMFWVAVGLLLVALAALALLWRRGKRSLQLVTDTFAGVAENADDPSTLPIAGAFAEHGTRLNRSLNGLRDAKIKAQLHDQALATIQPEKILEAAASHTESVARADGLDCLSVTCVRFFTDRDRLAQSHSRLPDGTRDLVVLAVEDQPEDTEDPLSRIDTQAVRYAQGEALPKYLANLERLFEPTGEQADTQSVRYLDLIPLRPSSSGMDSGKEPLGALVLGRAADSPRLRFEEAPSVLALSRSIAHALASCQRKVAAEKLADDGLLALARAADATSNYTRGHSERVAQIAARIGKDLGLLPTELARLRRAALLHDLGSVAISQRLLDQEDAYDEEQRAMMRPHIELGLAILEPLGSFEDIRDVIQHHHEWWNGEGYPSGISGDEINSLARILTVADVYEALTSTRPYRLALEPERALAHLHERSGAQFDPRIVEALARALNLSQPS